MSLVTLFMVLLLLQTFSFPGQFAHMAQENPQSAHLRWPLTIVFACWILCAQIVLVAIWKLLALIAANRIFTSVSMTWVDVIVRAIVAAWIILAGALLYVGLQADDPGLPLLLFTWFIGVTVLGLLMIVMRALLRQATTLQTDMDEVI
ncbi:DUF2975 domain-containing protein [Deinococcus marmoris]|uniref:DUF2975 domain-containing protein n=1 Tax=Deinococcus marmoris TaxID=249408 RepID=UPI001B800C57|nr:DUF2975 domain-containing protein [Deinococcus marmoris]